MDRVKRALNLNRMIFLNNKRASYKRKKNTHGNTDNFFAVDNSRNDVISRDGLIKELILFISFTFISLISLTS